MRYQTRSYEVKLEERRQIMTLLRQAHEEGDGWVVVDTLGSITPYPLMMIKVLNKIHLVEMKEMDNPRSSKPTVLARITATGLHALSNNRLTYSQLQRTIKITEDAYLFLNGIADEFSILDKTRAYDRPAVSHLLEKIASRPEEFKRWFEAMFGKPKPKSLD